MAWLLPKRLVYWAMIRGIAHGTVGQYGNTVVPEFRAMDAVKRWGDDHGL